jgi:hypothetical protein
MYGLGLGLGLGLRLGIVIILPYIFTLRFAGQFRRLMCDLLFFFFVCVILIIGCGYDSLREIVILFRKIELFYLIVLVLVLMLVLVLLVKSICISNKCREGVMCDLYKGSGVV